MSSKPKKKKSTTTGRRRDEGLTTQSQGDTYSEGVGEGAQGSGCGETACLLPLLGRHVIILKDDS